MIDNWLYLQKILTKLIDPLDQYQLHTHIIQRATKTGQLHLLRNLKNVGPNFYLHWHTILAHALEHGHIDILNWLLNIMDGKESKLYNIIVQLAIFSINRIKWYEPHRYKFPFELKLGIYHVCLHGRLDILEQIHRLALFDLNDVLRDIIHGGNSDTIQWFYDKNVYHYQFLKRIDHINVLKWLVVTSLRNIAIDEKIAYPDIARGNIQILEWLWERNTPIQ